MMAGDDEFIKAAQHIRGLTHLDEKTMLKFYGLYKQVQFSIALMMRAQHKRENITSFQGGGGVVATLRH